MRCPHCGADQPDQARFCGVCGRAATGTEPSYKDLGGGAPAATPDLVGREIGGRYRVLAKLGEGGMGAVYRGEQISLKRSVAIKVLRPELSRDPGLVRRFNAEAELAAKLSHPHTVNIYDFGQDADGSLFIAMEMLEGRSLRQAMTQDGPLPPWRALSIAQQIAGSLADAHRHGIVHRDLKPDNVMLTERGRDKDVVRVLDFGIAKLRDDNRQTVNAMTRAGDLVGTPQYMAPEQIRGEQVDGRTDVYALGAMLYEMLTGRLPFEGPTVMAILSKHLIDNPEPPSVRRPDLGLPPALDGLVMAALSKDAGHRPPTMERFGEDLAALYAHLGGPRSGSSAMMSAPMPASMSPMSAPPPMSHGGQMQMPPGPPPPGPAPAPSFAGPPPGVPRTFPPGMMMAPPGSAPPHAGPPPMSPAGPPPHAVGPAMTPAAPYAARPAKKSNAPVFIAIAVVLLAAGGAVAFMLTRDKQSGGGGDGEGTGTASAPTPDPDDPWAEKPGPGPGPVPAPVGSWTPYTDDDAGWSVRLPPGVGSTPQILEGNVSNFTGMQGGTLVVVGAVAAPNQGAVPTQDQLDAFAAGFAANLSASIIESGYVSTQGKNRYRVVMENGADRAEARFYIEPHVIVLAYYGRNGGWDDKAGERREFFESVTLPSGGM